MEILKEKQQYQIHSMSAFTVIRFPNTNYVIDSEDSYIYEPKQKQKQNEKEKKPRKSTPINHDETIQSSRVWSEKATLYVLLKYFFWKYTQPAIMSLHEMYKTISASVALDMGINKTSTQIRDKINNIKSGYKKDKKTFKNCLDNEMVFKHISVPLYNVMDKYFDEEKVKQFDDILKEITKDIYILLH